MKRSAPLKRKVALRAGKRLRSRSAKQERGAADLADAQMHVYWRSGGRCEAVEIIHDCTGRGEHYHHILARSAGGKHEPENLLYVCFSAHLVIHSQPRLARECGYLRSRYGGKLT